LNRVRRNSAIQAHDEKQNNFETKLLKTLPMSFGLFLPLVCDAMSDVDGIEIAELPPPYVPVFFAISILVGAGILTLSLGDVMEEEAALGLMSGAEAKKEKERSRSSYFKNR